MSSSKRMQKECLVWTSLIVVSSYKTYPACKMYFINICVQKTVLCNNINTKITYNYADHNSHAFWLSLMHWLEETLKRGIHCQSSSITQKSNTETKVDEIIHTLPFNNHADIIYTISNMYVSLQLVAESTITLIHLIK